MDSEITKLRDSRMPADFVRQKNGIWNHRDWLEFLARVRKAGYTTLPDHEVGRALEDEKMRFLAARSATARRPRTNPSTASERRASR